MALRYMRIVTIEPRKKNSVSSCEAAVNIGDSDEAGRELKNRQPSEIFALRFSALTAIV